MSFVDFLSDGNIANRGAFSPAQDDCVQLPGPLCADQPTAAAAPESSTDRPGGERRFMDAQSRYELLRFFPLPETL